MKTIYRMILSLLCLSAAFSCNFLDVDIQNVTTKDNYYRSEQQLQEALDGVYAVLNDGNLYGNHMLGRMGLSADLGYEYYKKDANTVGYYQASTADGAVTGFWQSCYAGINRANMLLENIDRATASEAAKKRIKGEALFLRGYYYYMLVKRFGNVPIVLKTINDINTAEKFTPQTGVESVYNQIIDDMSAAESLVLPQVSQGWQVSQTAVWGMLARVCLNMAGHPVNKTSMYATAAEWAKKVIDSGKHELNPSFEQVFINYAQKQYDVKESMFEVNFWGDNEGVYATAGMVGRNIGIKSKDESPIGYCEGMLRCNPKLYYLYDATDVRRDWTISNFEYTSSGKKNFYVDESLICRRYCAKYRREYESSTSKNNSYTEINFPILRYSDVLLMYAECYAASPSSCDKALALESLNMVRRRGHALPVSTPAPYVDFSDDDPQALMEEIRDERARELAYEMLRKDDICRWGIFYTSMKEAGQWIEGNSTMYMIAANTAYASVRKRDEFWPIPAREISVNPRLTQNNGW